MPPAIQTISGQIIDIRNREIFPGRLEIRKQNISKVIRLESAPDRYILPGFIDAHVHIESSMLVPSEFARLAVCHGTVATVSDPHEIGNVLGVEGVQYMIENGKKVPFKFYFGAPSCVPATAFETAGAEISVKDIRALMKDPQVKYLAEMMNWPGVLNRDEEVLAKLKAAQEVNKPVDGHAPGLKGEQAAQYIGGGGLEREVVISTDHECFTLEEALDKLKYGMKIVIREGSAAKNFEALIPLIKEYPDRIMFCSDDKHPDNLVEGHINELVKRALRKGYDLFDILRAACLNPIEHYNLEIGTLREGDFADFIVIDNVKDFKVKSTFINGELVFDGTQTMIPQVENEIVNRFGCAPINSEDIVLEASGSNKIRVIQANDGQLITNQIEGHVQYSTTGNLIADVDRDILKLVVVNRYTTANPSVAFIKGFGLKKGALASSVAHDSHNIIAVGVADNDIVKAINEVIRYKGGISATNGSSIECVPLPVAGLMSGEDGFLVARDYSSIDSFVKSLGSTLSSPFMTLSFMALLVIPELKLSDKGLFDGTHFQFVDLSVC